MAFRGVLPEVPSFGTQMARGLGGGFSQGISTSANMAMKLLEKKFQANQQQKLLDSIYHPNNQQSGTELGGQNNIRPSSGAIPDLSDEQIANVASQNPTLGKILEEQKKSSLKQHQSERDFEYKQAENALKRHEALEESLPMKQASIRNVKNAILSGEGGLDQNYLAEITGFEPFRTASGAQLKTAGKEFFLNSITKAGSRPNMYIEQQIGDMLPKIGRTKEANLTAAELLQFEVDLDAKRIETMNNLMDYDREKFGFVKGDIGKRTNKIVSEYANIRQDELAYDLQRIKEQEMGSKKMNGIIESNKKVSPGTPLTVEMARVFYERAPGKTEKEKESNAEKMAKKFGYSIPNEQIYMRKM